MILITTLQRANALLSICITRLDEHPILGKLVRLLPIPCYPYKVCIRVIIDSIMLTYMSICVYMYYEFVYKVHVHIVSSLLHTHVCYLYIFAIRFSRFKLYMHDFTILNNRHRTWSCCCRYLW